MKAFVLAGALAATCCVGCSTVSDCGRDGDAYAIARTHWVGTDQSLFVARERLAAGLGYAALTVTRVEPPLSNEGHRELGQLHVVTVFDPQSVLNSLIPTLRLAALALDSEGVATYMENDDSVLQYLRRGGNDPVESLPGIDSLIRCFAQLRGYEPLCPISGGHNVPQHILAEGPLTAEDWMTSIFRDSDRTEVNVTFRTDHIFNEYCRYRFRFIRSGDWQVDKARVVRAAEGHPR